MYAHHDVTQDHLTLIWQHESDWCGIGHKQVEFSEIIYSLSFIGNTPHLDRDIPCCSMCTCRILLPAQCSYMYQLLTTFNLCAKLSH